MDYQLKLKVFEGPVDLLLHLIENAEIDIYDIPISEITRQYIDYLFSLDQLDLDTASAFLVMAATLISIKVKMLLPKPRTSIPDGIEEDPRADLVRQLLNYKMFKKAAASLEKMQSRQSGIALCRTYLSIMEDCKTDDFGLDDVELADLVKAYLNAYSSYSLTEETVSITKEIIPIRKKIEDILKMVLSSKTGISFKELIINPHSKHEQIVTFLAVLELARSKHIQVYQDANFYEITIFRRSKEG